mgnify:CR=1 FL=1
MDMILRKIRCGKRWKAKDQVIGSLEAGVAELEKQRDKAQDEMQKIMDAKAEEEEGEEEGPDTSDVRV